ncbi:MAG TPA: glycosyltransferase family 87 protein [Gaiellaceae bacterium]
MRRILLGLAVVELALVLVLPAPSNPDKPGITGGIRTAAAQLRGEGPPVDLVQDYYGARALGRGGDPYPVLTRTYASVGLDWRASHRSTHPPTAFLLLLPVAWMPWKVAAAVWGALMLVAIGIAWWALGARPELAAALTPLTILWPPGAWSLGQLTPLWLLGIALAWRFRDRPDGAGTSIAVASLTKFLPALALVPFLVLRRWRVLGGFALVWAIALVELAVFRPSAFGRYLSVATSVGDEQAGRGENSALLPAFAHHLGPAGLVAAAALVAAVVGSSIARLRSRGRLDEWTACAWAWASVALLPIAWIYSLLPLVPALWLSLRRGGIVSRALALVAIAIPLFVDPFGLPGGIRLALATAAVGAALITSRVSLEALRRESTQRSGRS